MPIDDFAPYWLYNAEHQAVLVETPEQAASLEGEWQDTPAAFGVETHPEAPMQRLTMPGGVPTAMAAPPAPPDPTVMARLANLEALVQAQDRDLRQMGSTVQTLHQDLGALAQQVVELEHTPAPTPPPPASRPTPPRKE